MADDLDTLRRRFRQLVRAARWTRSRTPSGAPMVVGRLPGGPRVLVWPQADGRLRIGVDQLRVPGLHLTPLEALVALEDVLAAESRPRYARAREGIRAGER